MTEAEKAEIMAGAWADGARQSAERGKLKEAVERYKLAEMEMKKAFNEMRRVKSEMGNGELRGTADVDPDPDSDSDLDCEGGRK